MLSSKNVTGLAVVKILPSGNFGQLINKFRMPALDSHWLVLLLSYHQMVDTSRIKGQIGFIN